MVSQALRNESKRVKTPQKAKAPRKSAKSAPNAITLLSEDHKAVKKLFAEFGKLGKGEPDSAAKAVLVNKICMALRLHAQLEEEIFYPVVRAAIRDDDLMDEADVEHAGAKDLIRQLEAMDPGDDHYDAKVTVLGENIDHHVKEEQDEMFRKARKTRIDMQELGMQIVRRRNELRSAQG